MVARRGSRATSRSASSRPWALTARRSCSPATARMRSRRSPRSRRRCRSPGSCCRSREPEFRGATARALRGSAFPCYMGGSAAPPIAGRSNPVSVRSVAVAGVAVLLSPPRSASAQATAPLYDSTVFAALNWREIGIFRGGRSVAVAGSASRPNEYWFGTVGGGVFKSTDGGNTWLPMSDKYFGGTIGAIGVSESNPDIVYVGTGEYPIRGNVSHGEGVFKTTDGGKKWEFVGLAETQQISRVRVHPANPDIVWVGAEGHAFGPNAERGVYKSTDGGKSWRKVLFRNDSTGLSVSAARPSLVWALIEADAGGVYRTDDGGGTWRYVNAERKLRQRPWYYSRIFADPKDTNTVYALNVLAYKSTDGGATFRRLRDPHGDNHDMWIAATDPQRMIEGNDGGANVSFNGGKTWSDQDYATAQYYHVTTTNHFPYRVCAAQQDNSGVCGPSRWPVGIDRGQWCAV